MKLYLDNSFLNRLFDDPLITPNKLEGEVLLWVIDLVQQKKATLVHSALVEHENSTNPFPDRRSFVTGVMRLARLYQDIDEETEARAATLVEEMHVQPVDALHIAAAEELRLTISSPATMLLLNGTGGISQLFLPYPSFMTTKTITHKSSSILAEAMEVLLQHLGPQKTAELWQVISAPGEDYLKIRKQLFAGKDVHSIFTEAKRFNRK